MSKRRELIKNTLIIGLGKVSTQLISFFLLPIYTLFLSPTEYGAVDLIATYIALLVPTITLQLEMASFRFLIDARNNEADKKRVISNVLLVVLSILVVSIVLFLVLIMFIHIPYANLILLNIIIAIFSNLFLQFARGLGDNKKFAIACTLTGLTTLVASILLIVFAHMGANGMLLAMALANLACSIYLFLSLKLYKYVSFTNSDKILRKKLIDYSFPLIPNNISWWAINVSDRTIISIILGVTANGIYAVANKYAAIFSSISSIFLMSWTESASMHINDKDRDKFFSETSSASIRIFGSLGLILIAYIPLVFTILINSQFSEAYLYVPLLIIAAFFNAVVGLYSAVYIAKKMTKQVANTSIIAAIINITMTITLMQFIGLYAAAIATAVAFLAMAVYRHYDVKKYVTITYEKNIFVKLALAYAIAMTLYYYNNFLGNIANALIITVVVILFNKSMIKIIKNKIFAIGSRRKQQPLTPEQEIQEELL